VTADHKEESLMTHVRKLQTLICVIGAMFVLGACGDDDEGGSASAAVGDCINASQQVVDCSSGEAEFELVSDQSEPDAIACIVIDDPPQEEVEVDGTTYCAEPLE
jgi:uncharacterized protein YgiB involved in biofilm formation